ncbi:MAG TPA: hypothetical protein VGD17_02460 [Chitinophagaceae bacterium]
MKLFYFTMLFMAPFIANGQGNGFGAGFSEVQNGYSRLGSFFNVVNSEPVTAPNNPRQIEGSPYFSEVWMKGIITLNNGQSYSGSQLKVDLLNTKVIFIDNEGKQKVCNSPVNKILLLDTTTGQVHAFVHSFELPISLDLKDSAWLEILQPGRTQLLKHHKKEMVEVSSYASVSVDRIKTQPRYYLQHDNRLFKVNSFRDLREILKSHNKAIEEYMKKTRPQWKDESHIRSFVSYINTL